MWRRWANEAQADIVGMLACGGASPVGSWINSAPVPPPWFGSWVSWPDCCRVHYVTSFAGGLSRLNMNTALSVPKRIQSKRR